MAAVLQPLNQQPKLKLCIKSGNVPGAACVFQRVASVAANERKVFILHDEGENATAARMRTESLARLFDVSELTTYYRNARHKAPAQPGDGPNLIRMSWCGRNINDLNAAVDFVRYTCHRKGVFAALIGLGNAGHVIRILAKEHNLGPTPPDPVRLPKSGNYPITILTPTMFTTFYVSEPAPFSKDALAELPTLTLPVESILAYIKEVIRLGKRLFDAPIMSLAELRAAKLAKRQELDEAAKQKEADIKFWKEMLARKEAGEDVEVPEKPLSGRKIRKKQALEARMKEMWGGSENTGYDHSVESPPAYLEPLANLYYKELGNDCIADTVLVPSAEPVVPCRLEHLQEMIQWLEKDEDIVASQEPRIDFTRGSILGKTTQGGGTSVDLCKQVVGPKGITPILDAVAKNSHIDRFLLGNNIVGDEGARAIADFIWSERSKRVYNFYIAGNSISPEGIRAIADALVDNETVTALWLKRNPLLPQGARYIASMISLNTTLQTLDLVNTGILDQGVVCLMQALQQNPASALRHLYLGCNAEGPQSGAAIGAYLRTGFSRLTSLFCSCSRLGDQGAISIAEGLKVDRYLERLGLESARIGDVGARALADALEHHPALIMLDLGFRKGTYEMGELPNRITDEGLLYLGQKLIGWSDQRKNSIRTLDVTHNKVTRDGAMTFIHNFVLDNSHLLHVRLSQIGAERNLEVERITKRLAKENKEQYFEVDPSKLSPEEVKERERVKEALDPKHIAEIYSIYRGNM